MRESVLLVAVGCLVGAGAFAATPARGAEEGESCIALPMRELFERAAPKSMHGADAPVITAQLAEVDGRPTCSSITVPSAIVRAEEGCGFVGRLCKLLREELGAAGSAPTTGFSAARLSSSDWSGVAGPVSAVDRRGSGDHPDYRACTLFSEVRGQLVSVVALFTDEPDGGIAARVLVNAW